MKSLKQIERSNQVILTIDKSKFIADLRPISSVEEAKRQLAEIRALNPKANHHCYAYRFMNELETIENQSDDGEPAKTAGFPILEQIRHYELLNVLVVVTRFFGGTLLGTGGLIRAYADSARQVIEATQRVDVILMQGYELYTTYENSRMVEYQLKSQAIKIDQVEYQQAVIFKIFAPEELAIESLFGDVRLINQITRLSKRYVCVDELAIR